jgi:zinc protease
MAPQTPRDGILRASDLNPGLHIARLPDGLKVIVQEDHRCPVAICNVWVKVGSNREPEALRGWSHGIEHMLFKGTGRRNEGDFAREVAMAGGATNAGTGYETTNYHITVPAANLPVAVDILGDALLHSSFEPDSLDAERQVLVHENHMYDDIPFGFGVTWRWGMELTFDRSPYRHPIGGRDENLLERDRDDIMAFWRSAYRPDNMTVVIAGDVDPHQALDLVRERFAAPPESADAADDPAVTIVSAPPVEPDHDRCRLRLETGEIKKAYAKLIFPAPGDDARTDPISSVIRRVLSDGRSCRLYRRVLEEQKLVDNFAVMTEAGLREGVALVDIETDPERLPRALVEVARVLEELGRDSCTEEELTRARTRVSRSFLFGAETVQGQAGNIGHHDVMEDLAGAFNFPRRVDAVTRDDVGSLCRQIFRLGNLNVVIYLPEDTDATAAGIPTDAAELADLLGPVLGDRPAAAAERQVSTAAVDVGGGPVRARPAVAAAGSFETTILSCGAEVSWRVDRAVPVMAMSMCIRGGATGETAADAGLAALTQMVQIKGTGSLNGEALHEELENEGASLSPVADRDYVGMVLSGMSGRMDRPLELMGNLILDPAFAAGELEQERRLALEQLAAIADSPFQSAAVRLREMIYGDHPYGRPIPGTADSLPRLTRADLVARHGANWQAADVQVVVSGDFAQDRLLARLEEILCELPAGSPTPVPAPGPTQQPQGIVAERMQRKQNQSVVLVAWPGPRSPHEDRVPLMLLKEILNGQSGRLFESLRNRRSLCYNTGSLSTAGFGQGMFMGYVLTAPESEQQARDALVEELVGMTATVTEAEEFAKARAKLLGNLVIQAQSNGSRIGRSLRDRIYGRDANDLDDLVGRIAACTPDEVLAVAARMIDPDSRFEVILGPQT